MSACQVIAKAAATALLAVTNTAWLLIYIAADHGLYLAYKVARKDIVYGDPMPTSTSYVVAPTSCVILKTMADFTGSPLWRLPALTGGAYWLFNLVMSQVSVFVCVYIYNEYATAPEGVDKIDGGLLWAGAAGLATGWLLAFAYFVYGVAVPELRHTLWSWTSGRQFIHDIFLARESDEDKFWIFHYNLLLWESDMGVVVTAGGVAGWGRWKEEKPAWFKVETVPDQFIPAVELELLGSNRKRRGGAASSVVESLWEGEEAEQITKD
jgi:hypothetical protein